MRVINGKRELFRNQPFHNLRWDLEECNGDEHFEDTMKQLGEKVREA